MGGLPPSSEAVVCLSAVAVTPDQQLPFLTPLPQVPVWTDNILSHHRTLISAPAGRRISASSRGTTAAGAKEASLAIDFGTN